MRILPLEYKAIMRRGFVPVAVIVALTIVTVIISGGLLAWKTTYLDKYLPRSVKSLLNKSANVGNDTQVPNGEEPETIAEEYKKNWKNYTNTELEFSFKYPADWDQLALTGTLASFASGSNEITLTYYQSFQGGREEPISFEEKYYEISNGSKTYVTVYYGLNGNVNSVLVDGTFYPELPGITFVYSFDLGSSSNGLEILSLILSTFLIF